jgi:hypothetical protein
VLSATVSDSRDLVPPVLWKAKPDFERVDRKRMWLAVSRADDPQCDRSFDYGFLATANTDEPHAHRPPARSHACSTAIRALKLASIGRG